MIDLSVIIVNRNGRQFLADCLNSVYSATRQATFEIIFVDNGSTDDSLALVKGQFPAVRIIANRTNLGFAPANNQGLKVSQGRYAVLLNTDTVVRDGAFDQMLKFLDKSPKAGACGPKLLNRNGTPQHQGGLFARRFWLSAEPVKVDYVIGACLMVRREVIDIVGGLDENFFFSNEDLDWGRRIRKAGWDIYFLPEAEVVHYGGFTINKFDRRLFVEGFRGGLYFCRKHYGNLVYQFYRWLLAATMALSVLLVILPSFLPAYREKLAAYWQIFWLAVRNDLLPPYRTRQRVLLVSNGHAEDLAAAAIGAGLKDCELAALPLVGLGQAYDREGIENLGLKKILPSGGFAKEGTSFLLKDLLGGLLGLTWKQAGILRRAGRDADLVVAVGDAYVVALCGLFARRPLIFVDGPKSVKIEGYQPLELWLMRRYCREIVVQDRETADYLVEQGLPARFLGNWVMDYVPVTGEKFDLPPAATVIGILPGTRGEAYANLGLILEILEKLYQTDRNLVGLIASTLDRHKIKVPGWELAGDKLTSAGGATALLVEGKFADVCLNSKLIIGLAGIANEQAVAFGKPVVCFPGSGPQTTLRRWQEIQKITGHSMEIVQGDAAAKAEQIAALLRNEDRLNAMAAIGRASKPQWGGVGRITALVKDVLDRQK
ncbi:MAG: lipid-A-disaccharide synthase-related protein [Candidatus Margulisiibacteriota bacterium]